MTTSTAESTAKKQYVLSRQDWEVFFEGVDKTPDTKPALKKINKALDASQRRRVGVELSVGDIRGLIQGEGGYAHSHSLGDTQDSFEQNRRIAETLGVEYKRVTKRPFGYLVDKRTGFPAAWSEDDESLYEFPNSPGNSLDSLREMVCATQKSLDKKITLQFSGRDWALLTCVLEIVSDMVPKTTKRIKQIQKRMDVRTLSEKSTNAKIRITVSKQEFLDFLATAKTAQTLHGLFKTTPAPNHLMSWKDMLESGTEALDILRDAADEYFETK